MCQKCEDQTDAPQVKYNFVPLSGLGEIPKDGTCGKLGCISRACKLIRHQQM